MPDIHIVEDDKLTAAAADFIADRARRAIAERGWFTLVLAGGGTPKPVYQRLANEPYRNGIDWRRVEIYFGDERCVGPDDPSSNWRMARTALGRDLPIPEASYHRMRGEDSPDDAAASYQAMLASRLGGNPDAGPPVWGFDLVVLGMGDNGHTASLFPGLGAVTEARKWVMAQYVEVAGMWRLTLTPVIINASRCVLFLVAGAGKAEMLARVLDGPRDPVVLPSQAIAPTAGELHWLLDTAAAMRLKPAA